MVHRSGIAPLSAAVFACLTVSLILGSSSLGQSQPTAPAAPDTRPVTTTTQPATVPVTTQAATSPATAIAPTTATASSAAPFTLDQLAARAEAAATALRRVEAELSDTTATRGLDQRLRDLSVEVTVRLDEGRRLLAATPSLDTLRGLEQDWDGIRRQLGNWSKAVEARRAAFGRDEAALANLEASWRRTLEDVQASGLAESEVAARAAAISNQLAAARARLAPRAAELQSLAAEVAAQDVRVADALTAVRDAQSNKVGRLLDRDSDPIWTGHLGSDEDVAAGSRNSFSRQWTATVAYVRRQPWPFLLHAIIVAVLALAAARVGRRWGPELERERATVRSACIFRTPVSAALLATMPLTLWLYPEAPRLLLSLLGASLLIPAVIVLTRMTQRPLRPLLYGVVVLYAAQLVVRAAGSVPALSRGIFLLAMSGGAVHVALFLYRSARSRALPRLLGSFAWGIIRTAARAAFVVMAAAALANAAGFVSLSRLIGDALLASVFVGVMLDAYVRVARALLAIALRVRPLSMLRVVQRNRGLLLHRATMVLAFGAALWWASITLSVLGVRRPVLDAIDSVLWTPWGVGAVSLSLGGIIAFVLAVTTSFLLSRFVRFLLEEDVYPRVHLARGVPNAVSTLLHYAILFLGFLLAVAALGYDMTKFTILAGAFGVGLGFGMQNIVNNFVSGLILLFERPIQVGDVVELDPATIGVVGRIGIRASIVRLPSAAEVIVPNGILIAGRVTNWTLSNRQRGFEVPVSVAAGSSPKAVMAVLTQAARENASVAMEPAPEAFVTEFLPGGGMRFELRVRTEKFDEWMRARSELVTSIDSALAARGIQRV